MPLITERVHSFIVVVIVLITTLCLMFSHTYLNLIGLFSVGLVFLFYCGLTLKWCLHYLPRVVIFSLSYFLFFIFLSEGTVFDAGFIASRILATSIISVCSLSVIRHEVFILFLCHTKIISVRVAYPLLFGLSSIYLYQKQLDLIKINARMRRLKGWLLPHVLFQFIVFSIRFSERGSMSLITRHLSNEKAFYYDFSLSRKDFFILGLAVTLLVVAAIG